MIRFFILSFCIIMLLSALIAFALIRKKIKSIQIHDKKKMLNKLDIQLNELKELKLQLTEELSALQEQQQTEKASLQYMKKQREDESSLRKEMLEQELVSYGNYLWEKQRQTQQSRMDKYIIESQQLIDGYDTIVQQHRADADFATQEAIEIIDTLRNEIDDYRAQCKAINEQRRQKEVSERERQLHMIQLTQAEKDDINRLLELSRTFNQKSVIYKLIWTAFLQKPFNEMINGLFGSNIPRNVIYCIEDQRTHKKYIGKTSTEVSKRWSEHIKASLGISVISKQKIHEALYGNWESFTFTVLEQVEKEKLSERERFYIDLYQSNIYGYNLKKGG